LYRRGSLKLGALKGLVIDAVERVGKNAVIRFRPRGLMLVNLGMTGRLVVCSPDNPPVEASAKHLHGRIFFEDDVELRYYDARRFGHIYVAEECDFARDLGIGPDPFAAKGRYLRDTLDGRKAPIKSLLLDQRILSGIGNIYADEILFYARLQPRAAGASVASRAATIIRHARRVLEQAIEHGGSTLRDFRLPDGRRGEFQTRHAVYGRSGEPCVRCGTRIRKIVLGGRGTHFCPKCQR
jgi:formamidopyrimidine-DNA glycosylase